MLGQIIPGSARLVQLSSLCEIMSCYIRLGQVRSSYVLLCEFSSS
jgi:hypothetical protein